MPAIRRWYCLIGLALVASTLFAADWPQWRGPDRDDVSRETGLQDEWPADGPSRVWLSKEIGVGYSGFSVVGDTLYTMGAYETSEQLIAVNVADGSIKWSTRIGDRLENGWGDGPRSTPTVDGDKVYALSGQGSLACVSAADGGVAWKVEMSDFGGKRQYVQLTQKTLVGVDAANGDVLWTTSFDGRTAVIPTPIFYDGCVYVASGYGAGCKLVRLNDTSEPDEVYVNKNMTNHHGGVILVGDHLYGYSDGKGWVCQDFKTGEIVWNEKNQLGKGSLTCAGGKLYLYSERGGEVALIDPSPKGYKEHGRFKIDPQSEQRSNRGGIWTHPVVANGRLFVRDQELLAAYDVRAN